MARQISGRRLRSPRWAGGERGRIRGQVRLSCESRSNGSSCLAASEQYAEQRRRRSRAPRRRAREAGVTRARWNSSKRSGLGGRRQLQGRFECAGLEARLGCGDRPLRHAESGSSVSSTARCRKAAAAAMPPRACARPAERSSSAATSSSGPEVARARCQARRSGSLSGIGRIGERTVHAVAVLCRRRSVGGRSHERMRELDPAADREQPGVDRRVDSRHVDLERLRGRVKQDRVTERLGGRGQHQELRVARKSARSRRT